MTETNNLSAYHDIIGFASKWPNEFILFDLISTPALKMHQSFFGKYEARMPLKTFVKIQFDPLPKHVHLSSKIPRVH